MPFLTNRSQLSKQDSNDEPLDRDEPESSQWPSAQYTYTPNHDNYTPSSSSQNVQPPAEDPLAAFLLAVAEFGTKMFVTHPCTVLRRQCQVHQNARSLHLTPLTLVPVVCNIVAKEGVLTFWKGSLGTSVVWGLSSVTEIVFSDLFGLPRTYVRNGSTERYWRYILLKASTFFAMTPFLISSFTETVRSESGLGGEDNRVMDVIVKGLDRLRFAVFGARDASRRFSVLHLAVPTVTFQVTHLIIENALYHQFFVMAKRYVARKPQTEKSRFHDYLPMLFARLSSSVLTDLILFPMETILHRMYIQGTRTLIDNLDTGTSAVSITIKYSGFFDCLRTTVESEGFLALYSGLGALGLQYMLHSGLQQIVRTCFDSGSEMLRKAVAENPGLVTPPLSSNTSFNGPLSNPIPSSAPMFGPFAQQLSPITSPRKMSQIMSPPRDPTQFPTFGESIARLDPAFGPSSANRPNVFGSPTQSRTNNTMPPLTLNTDRFGDPFSG